MHRIMLARGAKLAATARCAHCPAGPAAFGAKPPQVESSAAQRAPPLVAKRQNRKSNEQHLGVGNEQVALRRPISVDGRSRFSSPRQRNEGEENATYTASFVKLPCTSSCYSISHRQESLFDLSSKFTIHTPFFRTKKVKYVCFTTGLAFLRCAM